MNQRPERLLGQKARRLRRLDGAVLPEILKLVRRDGVRIDAERVMRDLPPNMISGWCEAFIFRPWRNRCDEATCISWDGPGLCSQRPPFVRRPGREAVGGRNQ